jgi:hypothetical protein
MSPYRSDPYKNKFRRFWSTFVYSLHIIFVLTALFCVVWFFCAAVYRVSAP